MISEIVLAGALAYVSLIVPLTIVAWMTKDWGLLRIFHICFGITCVLVSWIGFLSWVAKKVLDIPI